MHRCEISQLLKYDNNNNGCRWNDVFTRFLNNSIRASRPNVSGTCEQDITPLSITGHLYSCRCRTNLIGELLQRRPPGGLFSILTRQVGHLLLIDCTVLTAFSTRCLRIKWQCRHPTGSSSDELSHTPFLS